jgi:hypothetical protein
MMESTAVLVAADLVKAALHPRNARTLFAPFALTGFAARLVYNRLSRFHGGPNSRCHSLHLFRISLSARSNIAFLPGTKA